MGNSSLQHDTLPGGVEGHRPPQKDPNQALVPPDRNVGAAETEAYLRVTSRVSCATIVVSPSRLRHASD